MAENFPELAQIANHRAQKWNEGRKDGRKEERKDRLLQVLIWRILLSPTECLLLKHEEVDSLMGKYTGFLVLRSLIGVLTLQGLFWARKLLSI